MQFDYIKQNIEAIKNNISKALARAGRKDNITLVSASKTMDKEVLEYVAKNGLVDAFGENRVQDLLEKYEIAKNSQWQFIGVLQTNKVKYIIDKVSIIQSVDRITLASEIDRQAEKHNIIIDVLVQVNMGCEETKSGYFPEKLKAGIEEIKKFANLRVVGIMAVMPIIEKEDLIVLYKKLGDSYSELKKLYDLKYLSAGMTNDYELAIEYSGANIIRVGRAITNKEVL